MGRYPQRHHRRHRRGVPRALSIGCAGATITSSTRSSRRTTTGFRRSSPRSCPATTCRWPGPDEWAHYQAKRAAWEKAAAGDPARRSPRSSSPIATRAGHGAWPSSPDDIQAILRKPESGADAAGATDRGAGLPAGRLRARAGPGGAEGQRTRPSWDELQAELKRSIPCGPEPWARADGDRRRAGRAADHHSRATASGDAIEPGFPAPAGPRAGARSQRAAAAPHSTGRRLALARWLSRPDNPLSTARDRQPDLAVPFRPRAGGHAQRLRPARRAAQPPRAARLAGVGVRGAGLAAWKPMHRLIVTSAAYRQAAQPAARRASSRARGSIPRIGCSGSRPSAGSTPRRSATPCSLSSGELGPGDRRTGRRGQANRGARSTPRSCATRRDAAARRASTPPTASARPRRGTRRPRRPRRCC